MDHASEKDQVLSQAHYALGVMLYNGKGVDKDESAAVEHFKIAKKEGHHESSMIFIKLGA